MSRYDILAKRSSPKADTVPSIKGARRGNPAYKQFSAYIPAPLYKQVKVRLAETEMDLSEAVEAALSKWLAGAGNMQDAIRK